MHFLELNSADPPQGGNSVPCNARYKYNNLPFSCKINPYFEQTKQNP